MSQHYNKKETERLAEQRAFDYELKRARKEIINLNLGFKHKPVQRPYNHDIQKRIRDMKY